jgi:hypothetical protein
MQPAAYTGQAGPGSLRTIHWLPVVGELIEQRWSLASLRLRLSFFVVTINV